MPDLLYGGAAEIQNRACSPQRSEEKFRRRLQHKHGIVGADAIGDVLPMQAQESIPNPRGNVDNLLYSS
jgi:hypothetical protein